MIGHQHDVTAEQLIRLVGQGLLQAIGKKPGAGDARHRQQQGHRQDTQFAGAPVTPQQGQGETHRRSVRNHCAAGQPNHPRAALRQHAVMRDEYQRGAALGVQFKQ